MSMLNETDWQAMLKVACYQLRGRYEQLSSVRDEQCFVQAAAGILAEVHLCLNATDLPPELIADYQQIERLTRARIIERQLLTQRPLF